jgi:cholesterol transport system auxiliary component
VTSSGRLFRAVRIGAAVALAVSSAGCASLFGSSAPPTYDLSVPRHFPVAAGAPRGQLIIPEPTALSVLDSDKIMVRPASGQVAYLSNVQWSDRLPKLLQARILQAFENASRLKAVGRPSDRLAADYQLVVDVRAFNVAAGATPAAEVELSVKVVADRSGRIVTARVFRAQVPAAATEGPAAMQALDEAFQRVVTELVTWATRLV